MLVNITKLSDFLSLRQDNNNNNNIITIPHQYLSNIIVYNTQPIEQRYDHHYYVLSLSN